MLPDLALAVLKVIGDIVLEAMQGQTPEQKKQMWEWYIEDMKWWRNKLKIEN